MKTATEFAYDFLVAYHQNDKTLVDGWRRDYDQRWLLTVGFFQKEVVEPMNDLRQKLEDIELYADGLWGDYMEPRE